MLISQPKTLTAFVIAAFFLTTPAHALATFVQDDVVVQRVAEELVPPEYPRSAERRRVEGSVTISYSISAEGDVVDPIVVESTPAGIFDRAALRAIAQWRYQPHEIQTDGHTYRLQFQLG